MSLMSELVPNYIDSSGLVAPNSTRVSSNGVMYTGEAMVISNLLGEMDIDTRTKWSLLMNTCTIEPGLIKRSPIDLTKEAPDDQYGYLAGAAVCDQERAKDWLVHGLTHFGIYNVAGPLNISDFLWRQPQMITHALFAAKWPVGPMRIFFIASLLFAIYQNDPITNTDARRLGWLLIQNWDGKGFFCRLAVKAWKKWLFKYYPKGMVDVCSIYYGPDHPFTKHIPQFALQNGVTL